MQPCWTKVNLQAWGMPNFLLRFKKSTRKSEEVGPKNSETRAQRPVLRLTPNEFVISRWIGNKDASPHLFGPRLNLGNTKMRISLADSLRHGFKKWSDAQDAKPSRVGVGHLAEGAERCRPTATTGEGSGNDAG